MKKKLITPLRISIIVGLTILLGVSYNEYSSRTFPANFSKNKTDYEVLTSLILSCCSEREYIAERTEVDEGIRLLMEKLDIDIIHYYPEEVSVWGGIIYLEHRVLGPYSTMYVYTVKDNVNSAHPINDCYSMRSIDNKWYLSNGFYCLFGAH